MRFDLTDLKLYVAVVRCGSITRGADAMNLALASASQRLSGMEASLGTKLLTRNARGVRPTQAGATLLRHAQELLDRSDRMLSELRAFASGQRGLVRLLSNTGALLSFLPRVLETFLLEYPGIDVDVAEHPSAEIIQQITERAAELGIVADVVDPGGLHVHRLEEDRLALITAANHRLAGQHDIGFADIQHEPMIGLLDAALEHHLADHAARHGWRPMHRVRLRSVAAIGHMVAAGLGVAILPESCTAELHGLAISTRLLADPWARRHLALCVKDPDALSRPARLLMQHIVQAASP